MSGIVSMQSSMSVEKCTAIKPQKDELWLEWEVVSQGEVTDALKNLFKYALMQDNNLIILPDKMYPCKITEIKFL